MIWWLRRQIAKINFLNIWVVLIKLVQVGLDLNLRTKIWIIDWDLPEQLSAIRVKIFRKLLHEGMLLDFIVWTIHDDHAFINANNLVSIWKEIQVLSNKNTGLFWIVFHYNLVKDAFFGTKIERSKRIIHQKALVFWVESSSQTDTTFLATT